MTSLPLLGALLVFTAADGELASAPGLQLHYRGTVAQVRRERDDQPAEKSFDLTWTVAEVDADGVDLLWIVDERGAGGFGWSDRAGKLTEKADGATVGAAGPAVLFDYGTGKHAVPLAPPKFALPESPAAGAKWERDDLEHEILRATTVNDRRTWEVQLSNNFGKQRTVWVEPESGVIVRYEARVFMNQGTEYRLAVELTGVSALDADDAKALAAAVGKLVNVKGKLKLAPRTTGDKLIAAQLQTLEKELPALEQIAGHGATARIVAAARRDFTLQSERTSALDRLVAEQTGKVVESFEAAGAGDVKFSSNQLRDYVTVLHFWDYRDTPLTEPYGQVGYLEFLYGRRKEQGLRVVGVAVDGRFKTPATAGAAASSVRRLKNFMNLTYPIVHDGGALAEQFGDPRRIGAELPLFVVVGKDGRIAHYKVGHYDVDREAGLKQLDATVKDLLGLDE
jgi:hypothetical protein